MSMQKTIDKIRALGKLSADKYTFSFPTIISKQRNSSKRTFCTVNVKVIKEDKKYLKIDEDFFNQDKEFEEGISAEISVESKLEGGKIRDIIPTIVTSGKNLGKINQTNVFSQALINANGMYTKKTRSISVESADTSFSSLLYPPMLAQDLQKIKKGIDWSEEIWMDPKLNGVRFISFAMPAVDEVEESSMSMTDKLTEEVHFEEGEIILYSRDRKLYHGLDYIRQELADVFSKAEWDFGKIYIDGEVYKHGENLQIISGIVRRFLEESKKNADKMLKLEYHIFDCFFPDEPELSYVERRKRLDTILSPAKIHQAGYKYLRRVKSTIVKDQKEVDLLYKKFIDEGYEGGMLRYASSPYEYSNNKYHSKFLIKLKPFFDEEFKIIGFTSGEKGKAAASLMLKMVTPAGLEFNVTPMGTIEERERLFKKFNENPEYFKKHFLGKPITIRYDELSKDGIPVRARAIALRNYE